MSEVETRKTQSSLQDQLAQIHDLLERQRQAEELLRRHGGEHTQRAENLMQRQNRAELQKCLDGLHPADIAYILEALPLDERLIIWQRVKADRDGDILLEVSDAVRETLIADMDQGEILAAVEPLDADELADLLEDLPPEVLPELMASLDAQQREQVQAALSYGEDQVGALMDFEMVTIREDVTLEVVLRYLRRIIGIVGRLEGVDVARHHRTHRFVG
jgi:magnesium transporter